MPIYEFRCNACRRRSSVFSRTIGAPAHFVCEHCQSRDTARLMSRVAVVRPEGDFGDNFDQSSLGDVDENDPRSVARWVRKISRDMGEPLDSEMQADLERMEAGEMPDDYQDDAGTEEFAGAN